MRKIPTVFVRDPEDRAHVLDEVTPGCEWVLAGEGIATRKWDGTCVMVMDGVLYARREVKPGKTPPNEFMEVEYDPVTGKTVGWEPAEQSSFWKILKDLPVPSDGTYELIGPKINNNPDQWDEHVLMPHGQVEVPDFPRTYEGMRERMLDEGWGAEGVVSWGRNGKMAKIKVRDFPR